MNQELIKLLQTLEPVGLQLLQGLLGTLVEHIAQAQATHPDNATPAPAVAQAETARRF